MPDTPPAPLIVYAVITRIPHDEAIGGNLATALGQVYYQAGATADLRYEPVPAVISLALRTPVFALGEILLLDAGGRELAGHGRKPSKWDVGVEHFATPEAAVARAHGVLAAAPPPRRSPGTSPTTTCPNLCRPCRCTPTTSRQP